MKGVCRLALVWLLLPLLAWAEPRQRPHAYAFDRPELLATQQVFGVGNAVTLLGTACADDAAARASYQQWLAQNQPVLQEMTQALAQHYRIAPVSSGLQQRVAEAMHLKTHLMLTDEALGAACDSLPDTLTLPAMNLTTRYQAVLMQVNSPDYLKPKRLGSAPPPVPDTQTLAPDRPAPAADPPPLVAEPETLTPQR